MLRGQITTYPSPPPPTQAFHNFTCCIYFSLSDIDECTTNYHGCHESATCLNTAGFFTCACHAGYTGNGKLPCAGEETFLCYSSLSLPNTSCTLSSHRTRRKSNTTKSVRGNFSGNLQAFFKDCVLLLFTFLTIYSFLV